MFSTCFVPVVVYCQHIEFMQYRMVPTSNFLYHRPLNKIKGDRRNAVRDTDLGLVCLERASSSIRRLLASSSCVAVCGLGSGGMLGSATKGCAGVGGDAERRRCLPHDDTLSRSLWVPPPVPLPLAGPLSSNHDNTRLSTHLTSQLYTTIIVDYIDHSG